MIKKVHIIDYGYGNLFSLNKALVHVGAEVEIVKNPTAIKDSEAIFLPGVGAFGDGILELRKRGFESPIIEHVKHRKPFFGICFGMQFLFDGSDEFGVHKGLGIIPGTVTRIKTKSTHYKIPHVGWNELFFSKTEIERSGTIFDSIQEGSQVYFVHSYSGRPVTEEHIFSQTQY